MSQYGDDSYDDVDDIDADFVTLLVLRLTCSVSPSDFPPSSQRQGRRLCPPQKTQPAKKGSKITWTIAMEKIPSNYLNYSWVTSPRSRCQTNLPKGQTQVLIIFFFNWVCQVCQAQGMIMKDGMTFVPVSLHLRWWLFIKSSSLTFPPERLRPSPLSSLSLDNLDSPRLSSGPEPNYLS